MRTAVNPYCDPEQGIMQSMAKFYGLPMFSLGGASESKAVDQQAAAEPPRAARTQASPSLQSPCNPATHTSYSSPPPATLPAVRYSPRHSYPQPAYFHDTPQAEPAPASTTSSCPLASDSAHPMTVDPAAYCERSSHMPPHSTHLPENVVESSPHSELYRENVRTGPTLSTNQAAVPSSSLPETDCTPLAGNTPA